MEQQQQQQDDEKFMNDNGFQCNPFDEENPPNFFMISVKEEEKDDELVKTIKRLRKQNIHCLPYGYLDVGLKDRMIRGPMSLQDAIDADNAAQQAARDNFFRDNPPASPALQVAQRAEAVVVDLSDNMEAAQNAGLEYFHVNYPILNSSITLYGENHGDNYTKFLEGYIKYLYDSQQRAKILIIESTPSDLYKTKDKIDGFIPLKMMLKSENVKNKIQAAKLFTTPIRYFTALFVYDVSFPNTRIINGDCRPNEMVRFNQETDDMIVAHIENELPDDTPVDETFLAKFISMWEKQLSIFRPLLGYVKTNKVTSIFERYNRSVEEVTDALTHIKTMRDLTGYYELVLKEAWASLSNLNMLLIIIRNMKKNVDITLFIGKAHMSNLTQSIQDFPFESYFETQELERMKNTHQRIVQQAVTMRRNEGRRMKFPDGSPLDSGGKRTRKHIKKRSTNKKCRIHKKRRRISKRH